MMSDAIRVYLIGKSGRMECLAQHLLSSTTHVELYVASEVRTPGLVNMATGFLHGRTDEPDRIASYAEKIRPHFAIIGPEEPLAAGVVDRLKVLGIPSVGPTQSLARIETSKAFARDLIKRNGIPGNPEFRVFKSLLGLEGYLRELRNFVVKPDGLTGGKGVRISGEHLESIEDALGYCRELLGGGAQVIVEEKLDGEEFSLQSFCDGHDIFHMIPVQDHKRALIGDRGPNTGGMGSYSCSDHLLPFLSASDLRVASEINERAFRALQKETHEEYKGILYGGYMLTGNGVKLIEFNARFGDPEVMNVLPLLQADFVEVCRAIIDGTLAHLKIDFARKATVCKYVVPEGYPNALNGTSRIKFSAPLDPNIRTYYSAVERVGDELQLTGSRAIAFVGIGDDVGKAESLAESAASSVRGPVYYRPDIGTPALIERRQAHMGRIKEQSQKKLAFAS